MIRTSLKCGAILALLLASAGAYADDATGVMEQDQSGTHVTMHHRHHGAMKSGRAAFSDSGPCQHGMQSEPFPNSQGYRCIAKHQ